MHATAHGVTKSRTRLSDFTECTLMLKTSCLAFSLEILTEGGSCKLTLIICSEICPSAARQLARGGTAKQQPDSWSSGPPGLGRSGPLSAHPTRLSPLGQPAAASGPPGWTALISHPRGRF